MRAVAALRAHLLLLAPPPRLRRGAPRLHQLGRRRALLLRRRRAHYRCPQLDGQPRRLRLRRAPRLLLAQRGRLARAALAPHRAELRAERRRLRLGRLQPHALLRCLHTHARTHAPSPLLARRVAPSIAHRVAASGT